MCDRISRSQARLPVITRTPRPPPPWGPSCYHSPSRSWGPAAVEMTVLVNGAKVLGAGSFRYKLCPLSPRPLFSKSIQMQEVNLRISQLQRGQPWPGPSLQSWGSGPPLGSSWVLAVAPTSAVDLDSQNMVVSQLQIRLAQMVPFWVKWELQGPHRRLR